ncbi:MAG: ferrous iron transport protein A [Christensenellaceae bacterium]
MLESRKLSQCNANDTVTIKNVEIDEIQKKRLFSMGFCEGQKITVLKRSNRTMLVVFGGKMLALGAVICEGVTVD